MTFHEASTIIEALRDTTQYAKNKGASAVVSLHGVPRSVFDALPGIEEHRKLDTFWAKTVHGVRVVTSEPPLVPSEIREEARRGAHS